MATTKTTTKIPHLRGLHAKGWTLRTAAPMLGVTAQHLNEVLRGRRHSRSLLSRLASMPVRKDGAA
jgi:hypothetical protein